MTTAALVLPPTTLGNTDASATRSASMPCTRKLRIHNRIGIGPHSARAARMMHRRRGAADVFDERGIVLHGRAGLHFQSPR